MLKLFKALLVVIFITYNAIMLLAKDYTNWSILTKPDLNLNLHNSQGIIIPNICPECIGLKYGNGFGYGLGVGVLYNNKATIFGMKNTYGMLIAYNSRNAKLENQAFLGNIIDGNTATKGLVNYSIDTKISTLEFEPLLYLYPISDMPLSFKLGLNISLPMTKRFVFKEEVSSYGLLLPSGYPVNTYPEAEIPNTAALFLGIPVGIKYDLYSFNSFKISPEINYNIAITDFHSNSEWNLSKLSAGFAIEYRISKAEVPSPKEPPMPNIPVFEENKTIIECIAKWRLDNIDYDSEANINSFKTDYYHTVPILPFVFFEHNSSQMPRINTSNRAIKSERINNDFQNMQNSFLADMVSILKNEKHIKITAYSLDNEDVNVGKARLDNTIQYLKSQGVSGDMINSEVRTIKSKSIKYPELADEYQSVVLNYSGINSTYSKLLTESKVLFSDLNLDLDLAPKSSVGIKSIRGEILLNQIKHSSINSLNSKIYIPKENIASIIKNNRINVQANYTIEDQSGNSEGFTKEITIQVKETKLPDMLNFVHNNTNSFHEYILALNSFDKQSPFIISEIAQKAMINAITNGKRIQIIGLTDNLGNKDYNLKLADRRVKSLLRLLNIDSSKVEFLTSDSYLFDNATTIGRMLNRSVVIRIYEN